RSVKRYRQELAPLSTGDQDLPLGHLDHKLISRKELVVHHSPPLGGLYEPVQVGQGYRIGLEPHASSSFPAPSWSSSTSRRVRPRLGGGRLTSHSPRSLAPGTGAGSRTQPGWRANSSRAAFSPASSQSVATTARRGSGPVSRARLAAPVETVTPSTPYWLASKASSSPSTTRVGQPRGLGRKRRVPSPGEFW